jgi:hypothetical protein
MKLTDKERSRRGKPCVLNENRDRLMAVQLPHYNVLVYSTMPCTYLRIKNLEAVLDTTP